MSLGRAPFDSRPSGLGEANGYSLLPGTDVISNSLLQGVDFLQDDFPGLNAGLPAHAWRKLCRWLFTRAWFVGSLIESIMLILETRHGAKPSQCRAEVTDHAGAKVTTRLLLRSNA